MIETERSRSDDVSWWPFGGCALEAALQVEALPQLPVEGRARPSDQDDPHQSGEDQDDQGQMRAA